MCGHCGATWDLSSPLQLELSVSDRNCQTRRCKEVSADWWHHADGSAPSATQAQIGASKESNLAKSQDTKGIAMDKTQPLGVQQLLTQCGFAEVEQFRQALATLSGDELARMQNGIVLSTQVPESERMFLFHMISQELAVRQAEGVGRKLGRFWKRHGDSGVVKVGLVALGALIGVQIS